MCTPGAAESRFPSSTRSAGSVSGSPSARRRARPSHRRRSAGRVFRRHNGVRLRPGPMLTEVRQRLAGRDDVELHSRGSPAPPVIDGAEFTATAASTGATFTVRPTETLLSRCSAAVCHTVFVSAGLLRHLPHPCPRRRCAAQDSLLTDPERVAGMMLTCVSRAPRRRAPAAGSVVSRPWASGCLAGRELGILLRGQSHRHHGACEQHVGQVGQCDRPPVHESGHGVEVVGPGDELRRIARQRDVERVGHRVVRPRSTTRPMFGAGGLGRTMAQARSDVARQRLSLTNGVLCGGRVILPAGQIGHGRRASPAANTSG